jgi:hypothetical protein
VVKGSGVGIRSFDSARQGIREENRCSGVAGLCADVVRKVDMLYYHACVLKWTILVTMNHWGLAGVHREIVWVDLHE